MSLSLNLSVTTDAAPAADRIAYFREVLLSGTAPSEVYGDDPSRFWARMDVDTFGTIDLIRLASRGTDRHGLRRTPELIRRADTGGYRMVLYQQGATTMTHNGRPVRFSAGDMTLVDLSCPYDGTLDASPFGFISIGFPRELLPIPESVADRLRGQRLPGRSGVGRLLQTFAGQLARDVRDYRPADALRMSVTLLDLVSAVFAHELDRVPGSHGGGLFERIQAYIEERLGDPDLTPSTIAGAHHISLRTLHRQFEPHGFTTAEWIRMRRLDRCRRDLADPALSDRPIHAIAARWAFSTAAHFTRTFRAAYGLNPQDFRNQVSSPSSTEMNSMASSTSLRAGAS